MSAKKRNFGLDVLRALSIVLVLIAHKIQLRIELGVLGVQIFFILSGFLIGQILISDFQGANSFSTVLHFWKRRWFRTLPLYYLVLTLMIMFGNNPFGWKVIIYYFFLQANFLGIEFFPITWSLVVEEWFYIFLPLASLTFFRKGIQPKRLLIVIFSFICIFFLARFFWSYFEKGVILYQFDCLLLGVLLSAIKRHYAAIYARLAIWPLACIGLIGVIFLVAFMGNVSSHSIFNSFYKVTWYFLVSLSIAFILPFVEISYFLNQSLLRFHLFYRLITWTSILSYSLYLLHPAFYSISLPLPLIVLNFLQFLFLVIVCFFILIFYERPVMNLRDEFSWTNYILSLKTAMRENQWLS